MFSNVGAQRLCVRRKPLSEAFAKMLAVELGRQQDPSECDLSRQYRDRRLMRTRKTVLPRGSAPKVEFPEGEIPLTGKVPGTARAGRGARLFSPPTLQATSPAQRFLSMARRSLLQG